MTVVEVVPVATETVYASVEEEKTGSSAPAEADQELSVASSEGGANVNGVTFIGSD